MTTKVFTLDEVFALMKGREGLAHQFNVAYPR
jgi:hypothetical protein